MRWTIHNLIGHPLSEIAYLIIRPFSKDHALAICGLVHDMTLPSDVDTNGRG